MRCCEGCGKLLPADAAPRKRFCSAECERRSYYEGRRDKDHAKEEAEEGIPLREFQCEQCGHWVRVMSKGDKRFRFCSAKCEKAFWKRNKPKAARASKAPAGRGSAVATLRDAASGAAKHSARSRQRRSTAAESISTWR